MLCSFLASFVPSSSRLLCVVAFASGALAPISFLYYGSLLDELNKAVTDDENVKRILLSYTLILFLSAVFSFFERYLLGFFAGECYSEWSWIEHVTRHYRDAYMKSVLQHDVEFIESYSPGLLGQRFSEQSSVIVNGLGPGLGAIFHAFAALVTGVIIGFMSVRTLREG